MSELTIQRQLTKAFIDRIPVSLVLTPRTRTKQPAGGFVWTDGTARVEQVMTLVEQTGLSGQPQPRVTADGVERVVEFELVAEWNALIARNDVFTYQGKEWEVVDLYFDNGYERRALVSARG